MTQPTAAATETQTSGRDDARLAAHHELLKRADLLGSDGKLNLPDATQGEATKNFSGTREELVALMKAAGIQSSENDGVIRITDNRFRPFAQISCIEAVQARPFIVRPMITGSIHDPVLL